MPLNPALRPTLSPVEKIFMSIIAPTPLIHKPALDLCDTDLAKTNTHAFKHFITPIFLVVRNSKKIYEFVAASVTCQMVVEAIFISNPK